MSMVFNRRHLIAATLLIVVVGFFVWKSNTNDSLTKAYEPQEDIALSEDGTSKTYTNLQYGFTFTYPVEFFLWAPSQADPSEELSPKQQDEKFQNDSSVWRTLLKKINDGHVQNGDVPVEVAGKDLWEIDVDIMDISKVPTDAELAEECEEAKRLNPHLSGDEACFPRGFSQEEYLQNEKGIQEGVVGSSVYVMNGRSEGTIIDLDGVHGVRTLNISSGTGDYESVLAIYHKGKLITLTVWLASYGEPVEEQIDPRSPEGLEKAINDPRNKAFDEVISSFKFI